MNRLFCYIGIVCIVLLAACDTNKKLSQDNAAKAIKQVAQTHTVSSFGMYRLDKCFNVQSIASIEPLSQFSDAEATAIATFTCPDWVGGDTGYPGLLGLKFVFRKDVDKRWFLTSLEHAEGYNLRSGQVDSMVERNHNLKVLAQ